VKYGFVFPYGDAFAAGDTAAALEAAGWDGFFVWEPLWGFDAWIQLAVAAVRTESIRLGTMITPLSRMRPWKLASEAITLDHLSNGRLVISVGLGAVDTGFAAFGEETDRKTRAELLDESLEIITGLWRGQPFEFSGKHYQVHPLDFFPPPPPVQQPRIPIWVVGAWPSRKSLGRAIRYDGLLPAVLSKDGEFPRLTPADVRQMVDYVSANRVIDAPFEVVVEGTTPGDDPAHAAEIVLPWAEAGATWWIEANWDAINKPDCLEQTLDRARQGPPRLD
jgi:alkanesulfonate monooxygenase SsuD/methylene tetrahydromethanopterin reductase-like flavin-dependent oxidoreductase (luciferase family)